MICEKDICRHRYTPGSPARLDWAKHCEKTDPTRYQLPEPESYDPEPDSDEEEEEPEKTPEEPVEENKAPQDRPTGGNKELPNPEGITRTLSDKLEQLKIEDRPEERPTQMSHSVPINRTTSEKGDKESVSKFVPRRYDGNRNRYRAFMDSVGLFFMIEDKYTTEDKKIAFILGLLDEKEAQTWRTNFLRKHRVNGQVNFPKYDKFIEELDATFKRKNEEEEALFTLNQMKQRADETAAETITRFKEQASLAGVPLEEQPRLAIDYLRSVLNPALVEKMSMDIREPHVFEEWTDMAIKFDDAWRKSKIRKKNND